MATQKIYKKRTSFWPTILSMALVLFIIGLLGLVSIHTQELINNYRNNFEVNVYFSTETPTDIALKTQEKIKQLPIIKHTKFIDRNIAAKKEIAAQGNDFIATLGYNPIPHSLELQVRAEMVNNNTLPELEKTLRAMEGIEDVKYAKNEYGKAVLEQINANFKTVEIALAILAVILLIVSIVLINSTVRLNMFARRFIIKSMQYVGASDWFIIKPFLRMYFGYALAATLLALLLLGGVIYLYQKYAQDFQIAQFIIPYSILAGILLILALLIVIISVLISTKRYLKLKIEQLY